MEVGRQWGPPVPGELRPRRPTLLAVSGGIPPHRPHRDASRAAGRLPLHRGGDKPSPEFVGGRKGVTAPGGGRGHDVGVRAAASWWRSDRGERRWTVWRRRWSDVEVVGESRRPSRHVDVSACGREATTSVPWAKKCGRRREQRRWSRRRERGWLRQRRRLRRGHRCCPNPADEGSRAVAGANTSGVLCPR